MKKIILFSLLLITSLLLPAIEIGELPLQYEGRIMPLETAERYIIRYFSGVESIAGYEPGAWLFELIRGNPNLLNDKIFLLESPQLLNAFNLSNEKGRGRYAYIELEPLVDLLDSVSEEIVKNGGPKDQLEEQIMSLFERMSVFRAFSLLGHFTVAQPQLDGKSVARVMVEQPALSDEQKIVLRDISSFFSNMPIQIVPGKKDWFTPYQLIPGGVFGYKADDYQLEYIDFLEKLFTADNASIKDIEFPESYVAQFGDQQQQIQLETLYNRLNLFWLAIGLALIAVLLSRFVQKLPILAIGFYIAALSTQLSGIILRMLISARPPVTGLYSSFLFVAAVILAGGLVWYLFVKKLAVLGNIGIAFIALSVLAVQFSAKSFSVVPAVLDTNYWLTVHVLTITFGYAMVLGAGVAGHWYVGKRLFTDNAKDDMKVLFRSIYWFLAIGLLFTAFGTLLGGIWADQSWGRFWGWDPKENGALLIVLWVAIMFHAKAAGFIKEDGFAIASIFSAPVVIFSWLGVNMLSTGLHSYGFTADAWPALIAFIAAEVGIIGAASLVLKQRSS